MIVRVHVGFEGVFVGGWTWGNRAPVRTRLITAHPEGTYTPPFVVGGVCISSDTCARYGG